MACAPQPPLVTCMFFGLAPPNITISLAWRAIEDHEVSGPVHRLRAAEHVRQEHQRGAETVIRGLVDEAAEDGHEAAQLPARLVKNSRRAPALRAGHDRVVAVIALDAREFAGDEVERALPRHRHERFAAAALAAVARRRA